MDAERWARIQELFHQATDVPANARPAWVDAACAGDDDLRSEVMSLLEEDACGGSVLDAGIAQLAHQVLGGHAGAPPMFGPYRITRVLGEGGMGVVYHAVRPDLGSEAAIKILRDAWLSPARRERFASEQRTLAQLNHPLIARLYDADTLHDGTPWFVMEYVDGVPLTRYCTERGASMTERLRLFRDVCVAVQHAHGHAIIHRDLKPSNILVAPDGGVKLLDFGIAKHLDAVELGADATRTGLRLMTPAYAAPEQLRAGRIGIHTDVYSLGVVLYELLTGRLPFDLAHRTPAEAESIIAAHDPVKPSAVARRRLEREGSTARLATASAAAWADLDVMCLTAMHQEPSRRYATVDALIRDIDHYLGGEPLAARPDSVHYRTGKFLRRNWRSVSLAAGALAAGIGIVAFYTVRLASARNAAVAETARVERIQAFTMNLFRGGDDAVGPADSLRVVTLLGRGVQEARALDGVPRTQAELYETLGNIYRQLGEFDRADSLIQASLDERRRLAHGRDDPDVTSSLVSLGMLRDAEAKYADAERLMRDGLAMGRRTLQPGDPTIARTTSSLGRILEDEGRYADAIATLDSAVRLQSGPGGRPSDLAESLTELANSHFYAGDYAISDSLNRRVLAMDSALYGPRHPNVADDLINLGAIAFEYGHYAETERYDRQALAITRAWYGNDNPETASGLTMLGRVLVAEHRYNEATALLRQALAIQEHVYGPVHPRVASVLSDLGTAALGHGNLDEAQRDFQRMADIYRTVYHDRHYYIGIALSSLAAVYEARKQYGVADSLFRDVIRRDAVVLPPGHQLIGIAHVRLGHVLVLEHRWAEARRELLEGYGILTRQQSPPSVWLTNARTDLATVFDTLGQPALAAQYRDRPSPP